MRRAIAERTRSGHAPDAKPWTVERMDPETVRLNAATSKQPSARIFAIRRA